MARGRRPLTALAEGIGLLGRHKRMWALVWAAHLAGAGVLAWSFTRMWDRALAGRVVVSELGPEEAAAVLVDLLLHHREAVGWLLAEVAAAGVAFVWLGAILAGGILGTVHAAGGFQGGGAGARRQRLLPAFLAECGAYAGRFSRLLLVQAAVAAVVLGLYARAARAVGDRLLGPYPDPASRFWAAAAAVLLGFAVAVVLAMVGDYAKVRLVAEGRRSALLAWWAGARWALGRLHWTLGLQLLFMAMAAAGTALYLWLAPPLTGPGAGRIWLPLAAQQAYLGFRAALRVSWYGAELALFRGAAGP